VHSIGDCKTIYKRVSWIGIIGIDNVLRVRQSVDSLFGKVFIKVEAFEVVSFT
jgi:hypothetical protein